MREVVATDGVRERLEAAVPEGVRVRPVQDAEAVRAAHAAVVASGDHDALPLLREAPGLELVQVLSAGTDWVEDAVPEWATLCNARGSRDVPVAEWVVGALLGAATGLLRAAGRRRWEAVPPAELGDWTVVSLGHGSIGRAVEERLAPFGTRVVGVVSSARDGLHGADELPDLLPDADALVVLLPLTGATRGAVDAAALARLPDGAVVVNAGRGAVVDAGALRDEVCSGRLRAVLDVTDPEPLPADDPLWQAETTLAVTGHHAGDSAQADERAAALAVEQVLRWLRGEPLENVVGAG
jgi:phosphoglycerate dehydrogenase-like enzyme